MIKNLHYFHWSQEVLVVIQVLFQKVETFMSGTHHMPYTVVSPMAKYFYRSGLKLWRKKSHPSSSIHLLTQSLIHSVTQWIFLEGRKQLFGRCPVVGTNTGQASLPQDLPQFSLWELEVAYSVSSSHLFCFPLLEFLFWKVSQYFVPLL